MNSEHENALGQAASAYLRSARHQPVAWMEWGAEAFARAQREDKPVLLDVGAVWCHWCHVMDRESYEDAETAAVINQHYVAVKVDRDERTDVDTRYQAAVSSISGQSGWPLTAFLTPAGMPFFGGTYFPAEERYGRPSFRRVLLTMADAFHNRRAEVEESAASVFEAIQESESLSDRGSDLGEASGRDLLASLIGSALGQFDAENGGFGSQPKFPHAAALDLLLDAGGRPEAEAEQAARAAYVTLTKMAAGGVYDQIGGGFHRYSVDERWHVPHFEKMAYDNSELLKVYAHAWLSFGEPRFAEVIHDILRWMDESLSDRERGGFYASQDADVSPEDDGDYYTWTEDEFQAVLSAEEFGAARAFFGVRAIGDMHHNPAKNVLRRLLSVDALAAALGISAEEAHDRLTSLKSKLQAARARRPSPYLDRTLYTGWNGMCISAYLAAAKVQVPVGRGSETCAFALRSLDRLLKEASHPELGLGHVMAYGESSAPAVRVPGVLEDYAFVATAALDAWEASGELRYFQAAQATADAMLLRFRDVKSGGFFDTETTGPDVPRPLGALSARRKPLQDAPTPAGNAVAASVLLRLAELTGNAAYADRGRETLQAFAGVAEHFGLYAASYGLTLRRFLEPAVQVCVLGDDALADELALAAGKGYAVNRSVVRLRRDQLTSLPPVLAETLPHLPVTDGSSVAVVCSENRCLPPVSSVEALWLVLQKPLRRWPASRNAT